MLCLIGQRSICIGSSSALPIGKQTENGRHNVICVIINRIAHYHWAGEWSAQRGSVRFGLANELTSALEFT